MRQQPCTVHTGDGYKVRYYKREVLIALVSVLDVVARIYCIGIVDISQGRQAASSK